MAFFTSVELPTTQPAPMSALPRINAPGRTSVSGPTDSGACNVDVRVKLGAFRDPHVFAALVVFLGRKCFAERFNELADFRQRLPRVGAGFKQRARRRCG